jgi:flagellar biosynthetic protein FliR
MARLQPQAQVFFIAIPLQMLLGFSIFAVLLGSIMDVWLDHTADTYIGLGLG